MFSALLLGFVLAQAEPAPDEPAPPPGAPVLTPAEPPLTSPDAEPEPAPAHPEREAPSAPPLPAAPGIPDPGVLEEAEVPVDFIGIGLGGARRLDPAAGDVPPATGFTVAMQVGHRYALVGEHLELGAAFAFAYQRYARTVSITDTSSTQPLTFDDLRTVTYYDFAALQTVAYAFGAFRPFLVAGPGFVLGHLSTQERELQPGDSRTTRPILRGAVGADVAVSGNTRVGLEAEGALLLFGSTFTTADGRTLHVFGNRVGIDLWVRQAF